MSFMTKVNELLNDGYGYAESLMMAKSILDNSIFDKMENADIQELYYEGVYNY